MKICNYIQRKLDPTPRMYTLVYDDDRTCLRAVPMVVLLTLVANLNEQIDSP